MASRTVQSSKRANSPVFQHVYNLTNLRLERPTILTIGVFDGVHRGHQHLISQIVKAAHSAGHLAAVLTLFPHPDRLIKAQRGRYTLTSPEQKAQLLKDLGVDVFVTHPFDEHVRTIRAADFVDLLREHLHMVGLWVTADFALGYQREGNYAFLAAQGEQKGFRVRQIDLLADPDHHIFSSSQIRAALAGGDVEGAAFSLGRPYRVEGEVVSGDRRGRTIGFPTANLRVWEEQIIPANGVYACYATLGTERFRAVTNIGVRPTFDGTELRIEAHLLDFDRDIYGQTVQLDFIARLRGEQRFTDIQALIAQIRADADEGRARLP